MWPNTSPAARHGFFHVAPQALISEAINKRAEKAWKQHKTEVVGKLNMLRHPFDVQHNQVFSNGECEDHHAQKQLESMQNHGVQGFSY